MKLSLPTWLLKLTGNIYLYKPPMWIVYKPMHHKVKGSEVRSIINVLQDGDILLRRYDGYLNTLFTPGFWGHAALYVGNNNVIHAVGEGVIIEDILDFCRCDSVGVYRPSVTDVNILNAITTAKNLNNISIRDTSIRNMNTEAVSDAIDTANQFYLNNTQYDYKFQKDNGTVYCTELVDRCYNGIFYADYKTIMGNTILIPDDISKSKAVYTILEVKH